MKNFTWSRIDVLYIPINDELIVMYKQLFEADTLVEVIPDASSKGATAEMTSDELVKHVREHYADEIVERIIKLEV